MLVCIDGLFSSQTPCGGCSRWIKKTGNCLLLAIAGSVSQVAPPWSAERVAFYDVYPSLPQSFRWAGTQKPTLPERNPSIRSRQRRHGLGITVRKRFLCSVRLTFRSSVRPKVDIKVDIISLYLNQFHCSNTQHSAMGPRCPPKDMNPICGTPKHVVDCWELN
jgi:hypothetical protein